MLKKEYGMKILFEEVFKVKDFDEEILNESGYLEGSFSSIIGANISKKGKKLIIQYLKKNKYLSFEIINAACKIYDPIYTNDKDCKIFANTIKNNTSLLKNSLDNFPIIKETSFNSYYKPTFDNILNNECFQFNELDELTNKFSFYHGPLFKDFDFYGIKNLLTLFSKYDYKNFYEWFINSTREDLKIIYCYSIVEYCDRYNNITFEHTKSKIFFLRVFAKMKYYKIHSSISYGVDTIYSIKNLEFNEENLYLVLYGLISYSMQPNQELYNSILKDSTNMLKNITIDVFRNEILNINDDVILHILQNLETDIDSKKIFFEFSFEQIKKRIDKNNEGYLPDSFKKDSEFYIELLKMYEKIFNCTKYVDALKNDFHLLYSKTKVPYFYYKNYNAWNKNLNILFNYIYIIYDVNNENVLDYIIQYKSVIKELPFYSRDKILIILNDCKK